ncbi:MAG: hypothetical protein ACOC8L_11460 [Spirochaetota bacterium]
MKTLQLVKAKLQGTTIVGRLCGSSSGQRQQRWVVPVAIVGVGVAAVAIIGMLFVNYRGLATLGAGTGEPDLALYTGVLASWAFVFLFGFPIAFSVLLFSKDTRLLISLPLHPFQMVLTNVAVALSTILLRSFRLLRLSRACAWLRALSHRRRSL